MTSDKVTMADGMELHQSGNLTVCLACREDRPAEGTFDELVTWHRRRALGVVLLKR